MDPIPSDVQLEAYLDEALPDAELAAIERLARSDAAIANRLAEIQRRRESGQHSLGAVWRRHRVGCPARSRLGAYLLGIVPGDEATFIRLHVEVVGCPYCRANLDDLRREHAGDDSQRSSRREKIFNSSAGLLSRRK